MTRKYTTRGVQARYYQETVLTYEGDECLVWPFRKIKGYGTICLGGGFCLISRLVCGHEHGPPPTPRHVAAHSCGRGRFGCVAKKHLSWKTATENEADKLIHGTRARGERHGNSKLTTHAVLTIRALAGKIKQNEIASRFGIGEPTVSQIINGKAWKWLRDEVSERGAVPVERA